MLVSDQVRNKILTAIQANAESNAGGDLHVYLESKYATSMQRAALKSNIEQFFVTYGTPDPDKTIKWCQART